MTGRSRTGDSWIVEFDYREDNGPTHVGPFNTKGGAEAWLAKQSGYEASVIPLAWHDQWLPTQPTTDARSQP